MESQENRKIAHKKHKRYLLTVLNMLPTSSLDSMRMTMAFFALSGLDILNSLDALDEDRRKEIIKWIYSMQVVDNDELVSGFQASHTLNTAENAGKNDMYKWGHIAATYCALCCLLVLGDDLSGVDREAISKSLRNLQLDNGCYKATKDGSESDMRFVYCAASICYILDDWSGMDMERTNEFILKSISYDFGIGQGPELESHGGSTYCAVATLALSNQLHTLTDRQKRGITEWLLFRQQDGFQGRPNKQVDTCYSFWVGGALKLLGAYDLVDFEKNKEYVMLTEDQVVGGFSKWVEVMSDPLHTYLGLAGLSLMHEDGLNEVFAGLNITGRAHKHLRSIHEKWRM